MKKVREQRGQRNPGPDAHGQRLCTTYLHAVHFILADDFDGDLSVRPLQIAGAVYVAEGTVSHLLKELPALEAGVVGELALAGIFFGNELGETGLIDAFAFAICVGCSFRNGCALILRVLGVCMLWLLGSGRLGIGDVIFALRVFVHGSRLFACGGVSFGGY